MWLLCSPIGLQLPLVFKLIVNKKAFARLINNKLHYLSSVFFTLSKVLIGLILFTKYSYECNRKLTKPFAINFAYTNFAA